MNGPAKILHAIGKEKDGGIDLDTEIVSDSALGIKKTKSGNKVVGIIIVLLAIGAGAALFMQKPKNALPADLQNASDTPLPATVVASDGSAKPEVSQPESAPVQVVQPAQTSPQTPPANLQPTLPASTQAAANTVNQTMQMANDVAYAGMGMANPSNVPAVVVPPAHPVIAAQQHPAQKPIQAATQTSPVQVVAAAPTVQTTPIQPDYQPPTLSVPPQQVKPVQPKPIQKKAIEQVSIMEMQSDPEVDEAPVAKKVVVQKKKPVAKQVNEKSSTRTSDTSPREEGISVEEVLIIR